MVYFFSWSWNSFVDHTATKIQKFQCSFSNITRPMGATKSLRFAMFNSLVVGGRFWSPELLPLIPQVVIFSCNQAALWMVFSARLSVCHTLCLCSHHRIIMKFSWVITNEQCKVHAKGQGQRSKVKVRQVTSQLNRFGTVTAVLIHQWLTNDAQSFK